jgi:uracil-DNA glycosylase
MVGKQVRAHLDGQEMNVVRLPHPSGASKLEPGRTLLERALRLLARHPEIRRAFPSRRTMPMRTA